MNRQKLVLKGLYWCKQIIIHEINNSKSHEDLEDLIEELEKLENDIERIENTNDFIWFHKENTSFIL